uniref:Uncharacterized protein n=1 Tax=Arundo donax TaxID=35708 RepID=A0A0A9CLA9_ARUDO
MSGTGVVSPSSSTATLSALRPALSGPSIPRSPSPPPASAATSAGLISPRSFCSALAAALVALLLVSAGGGAGAATASAAAGAGLPCASRALRAALRSTGILSHGAPCPRLLPLLKFRRRRRRSQSRRSRGGGDDRRSGTRWLAPRPGR